MENPSEMEDAGLWLWCFLGAGFSSAIATYFALLIAFHQNTTISGARAVLLGVVIGFVSAQIRVVRKIVGGLVESAFFRFS